MTHLDETYALLRDCWIAGGPGVQVAPDAWATLLTGDGDTDERRLLAIASQAFEVGLRPALGTHTVRPVLPQLANPVVPARLRPVVRRVLRSESSPARVLDLLARRGWTMHPLDWFPDPAADVPAVYAPWQDWAAQAAPRPQTVDPEQWRYLSPSGRRRGLRELRTTDPDAARALLAEHFGTEQAAVRLELLQVVGLVGLDAQDVPFLQSLATDRSGKVKTLACQLLARLGMTSAEPDDLAELRTFVTAKRKGLALVVRATETKTEAQARRRDQL
ncbi:MAG: DUF5691 domain-containing protein, partial [Micrococcales bacterium]|nr:DUF5691 domain-containing protein [Micrococcales bacterium]